MLNLLSREDACRKIHEAMAPEAAGPFTVALSVLADGLGTGPRGCRVLDLEISGRRASANLLALGGAAEVVSGDIVYPGLWLASGATDGVVRVEPLFLRLGGFNRLTWSAAGADLRCGEAGHAPASRRALQARVREASLALGALLPEGLRRIASLRSRPVDATWGRDLLREHGLTDALRDRLVDAWIVEGGERTRYGVLNALTRLATHAGDLPAPLRAALARAAEEVAFGAAAAVPRAA